MHLAMLYSAIKGIAHGCVQPWGGKPVSTGKFGKGWPKKEGLGIPGPANWPEFRAGAVIPFGMLLKCIAEIRFGGIKEGISF